MIIGHLVKRENMADLQLHSGSKDLALLLDPRDLVPVWIAHLELRVKAQEISADTVTGYRRGAMRFLDWLNGNPTPDAIRRWKATLLEAGKKPAAVNAWLAGVRSFLGWLAETNQIPFDPSAQIEGATRRGSKKRHTRQSLTNNEVRRLLACPDRAKKQGKRDYAILAVMLYTAARGIEMHRANIEDLHTEHGKLVLAVQGKGHTEKDEILVLPHEAETAVRDWLAERGMNPGALFVSLSRRSMGKRLSRRALRMIVKHYIRMAGIYGDNKTTHSLRHTAITSAIRNHVPAEKVRGMSRHVSLDTLMIYYHETDRIDDPAEAYINYSEQ